MLILEGAYRAATAKVLLERLSWLHSRERTVASAVREGLHVDRRVAAVDDNGLLGRSQPDGGGDSEKGELHCEMCSDSGSGGGSWRVVRV